MKDLTKAPLQIFQAAVVMGIAGDVLLRATPWGVNAFLFVTLFVAAAAMLVRIFKPELFTLSNASLAGAVLFFASMYAVRDSIDLKIFDFFAIVTLMGVFLLNNLSLVPRVSGVFHYAVGFIWSGITSALGPLFLLFQDTDWSSSNGETSQFRKRGFALVRGLMIALPLLLIFGGLFAAADAAFEGLVDRVFDLNIETAVGHLFFTCLFGWLCAGYFRGAVVGSFAGDSVKGSIISVVGREASSDEPTIDSPVVDHINRSDPPESKEQPVTGTRMKWQDLNSSKLPEAFTLGVIEIGAIFGLVDLLFLSFVIVQIPYLFGGFDFVQATPDLNLADYARRGFGELVFVSALVLPMLLLAHWLLRRTSRGVVTLFRVLAGIQIALLFVIMASAVQRLVILTGESGYGLTTVRFYPMVLMTWIAIVFVWFAVTVMRERRDKFAWGALWSAVVILGVTNLINPDALIARTNIALMQRGRAYDARYNSMLSNDAVPTIVAAIPAMNDADRCTTEKLLSQKMSYNEAHSDIRNFNLANFFAERAVAGHTKYFQTFENCPDESFDIPSARSRGIE